MIDILVRYILVLIVLLYVAQRFFIKPFVYWKERGVPSVPGIPIFGSLYEHFTKDLHEVLIDRHKKYGRIYGYYESSRPVLSVGDPELLRDILVKDFHVFSHRRDFGGGHAVLDKMLTIANGEEWKRIRTLVTSAFSSAKIKKVSSIIIDSAKITRKNFEKLADSKQPADCKKLFGGYTMDVIARTSFGMELDSHNDPDNEFVRAARATFTRTISLRFIIFFIAPWLLKLFRTSVFTSTASKVFEKVARDMISKRRKSGQKQNDFLQLLIDAIVEPNSCSAETDDCNTNCIKNNHCKDTRSHCKDEIEKTKQIDDRSLQKLRKGLSQDEVIAQCIIFMLAGYDTTSSTLSLISYNLALYPEYQEEIIQEIDDILRKNHNEITYESIHEMKLLESAVLETLRMYPPVIFVDRMAMQDYTLGNTGITIKKGMLISIPIFAIHRDPKFYEDPEEFDPNRFSPGRKEFINPYTNLAFGVGPRNCIGMRLAIVEMKFCMAILLSKLRFQKCSETKVPLEFYNGPGLLQPKGIILQVDRRTDCVK